ncbi:zinc finger BED domain-containing protein 4-like [Cydia pomonella]|uniref:zinc finger BED domain-containing protein 4-like n=1 Tax=Cydia pomonella TaxID=82600 RepID=UPI002ADDFC28|nr:zinc finger BED domain-containing protein 4-like [Cydia pomonella]
MSGSRKRSNVWTFFNEMEDDKSKVKCTLCNSVLSRGGTGRTGSTSALSNHLKLKHKEESEKVDKPIHSIINVGELHQPSSSRACVQQSIESSISKKWDLQDPRSQEIHNAIGEMIAVDNQPISIVEDVGFNRLIIVLKPKYPMPGRKYMSEVILPKIYEKVKLCVKKDIDQAKAVSVTTDMWTCTDNVTSFLSFTAHWLNAELAAQHRVLQMCNFTGQHTAEKIRASLETMAESWDLGSKVHIIVRDNGPNIVKATNDSPYTGKPCFIHTLQLAIKHSLDAQPNINESLTAARRIVTHFNHSSTAQEKMVLIQNELNLPKHKLIQDVTTRWNSTFYMCERLIEQKRAVSLYISDYSGSINFNNLTERQWQLVKELLTILQPFEEITRITSSNFSCISEVIPHVNILLKYLAKPASDDSNTVTMRKRLQTELKARFEGIQDDIVYTLATILDPRYKLNFFSNDKIEPARKAFLIEAIKNNDDEDSSNDDEELPRNKENIPSNETHADFWSCFEEVASAKPTLSQPIETTKSPIAAELDKYLQENLLQRDRSPYEWWVKNKAKYPLMAHLAKKWLAAPGSSVYSERLFSEAGNIYEKKRNRLLPDRAESLVFLHHNLPLLNFNY